MPVTPTSSSNLSTPAPDTSHNPTTPRFGADEQASSPSLAQQLPVMNLNAASITTAATNGNGALGRAAVLTPDTSLVPVQSLVTFGDAFDDIRTIEAEIEEFTRDIERAANILSPNLLADLRTQLGQILKAKTGQDLSEVVSKLTFARNMLKEALRIAEEIHDAPQETKVKVGILAGIAAFFRCCMSAEQVANDDHRRNAAPSRRTSTATNSVTDLELSVSGRRV